MTDHDLVIGLSIALYLGTTGCGASLGTRGRHGGCCLGDGSLLGDGLTRGCTDGFGKILAESALQYKTN